MQAQHTQRRQALQEELRQKQQNLEDASVLELDMHVDTSSASAPMLQSEKEHIPTIKDLHLQCERLQAEYKLWTDEELGKQKKLIDESAARLKVIKEEYEQWVKEEKKKLAEAKERQEALTTQLMDQLVEEDNKKQAEIKQESKRRIKARKVRYEQRVLKEENERAQKLVKWQKEYREQEEPRRLELNGVVVQFLKARNQKYEESKGEPDSFSVESESEDDESLLDDGGELEDDKQERERQREKARVAQ
jgi:hypothetical protein